MRITLVITAKGERHLLFWGLFLFLPVERIILSLTAVVMTSLVCLWDFLTLWMSVRLCPSILTPHFLWQQSFLSQMPVEKATMEVKFGAFITTHHCYNDWRSSIRSTQDFVQLKQRKTVSGRCLGNHHLLFPFVLHWCLCFTVNWVDLWRGSCRLKIHTVFFSSFSVPQVK